MTQTLAYGNGKLLAFADYGDRNGFPLLVQHGLIASIRDEGLFDRFVEAGVRLISIARPGYGDSSPQVMRNLAEWGDLVSVLVESLQLSQFDLLGISSGAPFTYAIASSLPDKARNVFIFSGIPALYRGEIAALWPFEIKKTASIAELQQLAKDLIFSGFSAADYERADIIDSMMNDGFGVAQDFKLRCNDWGFSLSDVKQPVHMQHSKEDTLVPFVTAEMTARLLPDCRFEVRETGEHFSKDLLNHFFEATMARYYTT